MTPPGSAARHSTLAVIACDLALAPRASAIVEIRDGKIVPDRPTEESA